MSFGIIFLIIIVIIFTIFILTNIIYNRYQDYIIRINEVESKIDETLRNKYDNILKINNIIKDSIKTDKIIVDDISKLKKEEKSSFEMDRILTEAFTKVDFIKKQYDGLKKNDELNKLFYSIDDFDESLVAYKKYYNENITKYNKLIRKFPYNLLGKILKYKEKTFFDGKDLNDENIKDFKL